MGDGVSDGLASGSELLDLFAIAGYVVANEVVPVPCPDVFDRKAGVEILVGLLAIGGEAVDVVRAGKAGGCGGVAEGEARGGIGEDGVADVGGFVDGVVAVEREGVGGVEAAEGGEVVERVE